MIRSKYHARIYKTEFDLDIKPISINAAFQGRRFKTPDCRKFEHDVGLLLPNVNTITGEVIMHIHFYLTQYARTDVSNLVKILEDVIVKKKIIEDDRKVVELHLIKFKSKIDKIKISIIQK